MMEPTAMNSLLLKTLADYLDPYLQQDLVSAKLLKQAELQGQIATLQLVLPYPCASQRAAYIAGLQQFVQQRHPELTQIHIELNWEITTHAVQHGLQPHPQIKNMIAVASGKGGVGKSTVAVNLALALVAEGARVGLLDADIYGPSQPMMLGAATHPESKDQKTLEPVERYGVQSMSIGYLIDTDTPMIWRGPMVSTALQQIMRDTNWHQLDYLIIDLPPGTGDIQLTLSQKIPVSGAVVVTTPQEIALLDARKAIAMFQKVRVPVLGVIENMSSHVCGHCGHEDAIFGQGGGAQLAQQYQLKLLGSLPLDSKIREQTDVGKPTVVAEPDSPLAQRYQAIARQTAAQLALQAQQRNSRFPRIVIE